MSAYLALIKPGILFYALVTVVVGYALAGGEIASAVLLSCLIGCALVFASSATVNQMLEVDQDGQMSRTKSRPLPSGQVGFRSAGVFSFVLLATGTGVLLWQNQVSTLLIALTIWILYDFVYTPVKKKTWLNTYIGSIPGALPPLCGWVAAYGEITINAIVLFAVFYFWQLPHFFAIDWLNRTEYQKAGFKMLSSYDGSGQKNGWHSVVNSLFLVSSAGILLLLQDIGLWYFLAVIATAVGMLIASVLFVRSVTTASARNLLLSSLVFHPLFCVVVILQKL